MDMFALLCSAVTMALATAPEVDNHGESRVSPSLPLTLGGVFGCSGAKGA